VRDSRSSAALREWTALAGQDHEVALELEGTVHRDLRTRRLPLDPPQQVVGGQPVEEAAAAGPEGGEVGW